MLLFYSPESPCMYLHGRVIMPPPAEFYVYPLTGYADKTRGGSSGHGRSPRE